MGFRRRRAGSFSISPLALRRGLGLGLCCRSNDPLVRFSQSEPLCIVPRRFEQIEHERVAALALFEAAREPQLAALLAERREVPDAAAALVGDTPIDVFLAEPLELELVLTRAARLVGARSAFALPFVVSFGALTLQLGLLASRARAVVLAYRAAFLGAKAHLASSSELGLGSTAEQRAVIHSALGLRFQCRAELELLAAQGQAP